MNRGLAEDAPTVEPRLLDTVTVARLAGISASAWRRLNDAELCPAPVRLGRLLRWDRLAIERWIADGCPPRLRHRKTNGGAVLK